MHHKLIITLLISISCLYAVNPDNILFSARLHSLWATLSETIQPAGSDTITISSAIGEYENCITSVYAKAQISTLTLEILPFTNSTTGRTIAPDNFSIKHIEYASLDSANNNRRPLFLNLYNTPLTISSGNVVYFNINAKSENRADTGLFNGKIRIDANGTVCTLNVKWIIRPYSLRPFNNFSCGAFLGSTRAINQATANDMKAHGIDAVQFFLGYESVYPGIYSSDTTKLVINDNGHLKVEFHALDSLLKFMKAAGMRGPVTPSIGNDRMAHLERDICNAYPQYKLDTSDIIGGKRSTIGPLNDPIFDTLLISAIRQFKNKIESYGFEMVLLIYDEPTERLMTQLANRYTKIKAAFPTLRTYGVVMDVLQWAQQVAPYAEVLVANGSFSSISTYAKSNGKDFWAYVSATSSMTPSAVRENYGIRFAKYNPSALFFWAYNYYAGNPYTFPDGDETGQSIVFPPSAANNYTPIGSPAWEGMREAVDDWRYIKTVESMLLTANGTAASRISAELRNVKIRISDFGSSRNTLYDSVRTVCSNWIVEILNEEGSKFSDMTIKTETAMLTKSVTTSMTLNPSPFNMTSLLNIPAKPFNGATPKVSLHTIDGRLVKNLRAAKADLQNWNAVIDGSSIAAGVYVVRAVSGQTRLSLRTAIIK